MSPATNRQLKSHNHIGRPNKSSNKLHHHLSSIRNLLLLFILMIAAGMFLLNVILLLPQQQQQQQQDRNQFASGGCTTTNSSLNNQDSLFRQPQLISNNLLLTTKVDYFQTKSRVLESAEKESYPSSSSKSCLEEYNRANTQQRVPGLTTEDLERSRAFLGNRDRLVNVAHKLSQAHLFPDLAVDPINVVVCGGSISLGHGIYPVTSRYSDQLEVWLNQYYPLNNNNHKNGKNTNNNNNNNNNTENTNHSMHRVYNKGAHGADMCAMAKRINILNLSSIQPDLFVLEFAVNDYQGQDHVLHIDHKTDIFFDGFQRLALCAEVVLFKLLSEFPKAAVVFLEFQTAVLNRKTAASLHMGVAQHYEVPVLSYADTMFPDYFRLIEKLETYQYFTKVGDPVLPYPHGCAPCRPEVISKQFRDKGCKSVCIFMKRSYYLGGKSDDFCLMNRTHEDTPLEPCYIPFLAQDAVHPSAVGHSIAKDVIVEALTSTAFDVCLQRKFREYKLPTQTYLASSFEELRTQSDFILVEDTMEVFAQQVPLKARRNSEGFKLIGDDIGMRKGWVSTNPKGGEWVVFGTNLPRYRCYALFLGALKSYENMGFFTVTVLDIQTNQTTMTEVDGIWKPHISVPADIPITSEKTVENGATGASPFGCTGQCRITVETHPQPSDRKGLNKVKIMTLSARKCVVSDPSATPKSK